ncbi:MAG: beta-N-acetylhexosaminidase [Desulfamplus sp.]|nr:beta-N-acetylhexosaminidase [Desulfamplus sp.]
MAHPKNEKRDIELLSGQRLMVGFEGTAFNQELKRLIGDIKVGGIVLFAINIESASQVKRLCMDCQEYARYCNLPPLFIAVDQEGGVVARLKPPDFTKFPGNPHIRDTKAAEEFAQVTARELRGVNINMNFAPVMDCIPSHGTYDALDGPVQNFESIMAQRAFPGTPAQVGELGAKVIEILQKNGIMAVAKHFPGIGRTTRDSHMELPVLDAPPELLDSSDMVPFRASVKAGVSGIMLSHILYPGLDPEWPASLSPSIARTLLRESMGFQGLTITDDLDMKAIQCDIGTSVRQILAAEVDIALICHKGPDIETAVETIKEILSSDEDLFRKGHASWQRIQSLKHASIML